MHNIPLRIKTLNHLAVIPQYQSAQAAGLDLHAAIDAAITIEPGEITIIPTGLAIELVAGWEAQIRPRSGLATRHGISIPNSPGTIDADYRGEIKVALINLGRSSFAVEPSMRVAQMVICPVARCEIIVAEELVTTTRGAGGFGSTGI